MISAREHRVFDLFAGIELGGTKVVCALANDEGHMVERDEFPAREPGTTLEQVAEQLERYHDRHGPWRALGIASFGPLRLNRAAEDFGCIFGSPKSAWNGTKFPDALRSPVDAPFGLDTDVGAAALAEWRWGCAQGCRALVYITVGTGIGGGILIDGQRLHGQLHPELGHIYVQRAAQDSYAGACPYHGACLEGLAAGPAILARSGRRLDALSPDHPSLRLEAFYLGQLMINVTLTLAPERIVLGGGVMSHPALLQLVRAETARLLNGYAHPGEAGAGLDGLIMPPALGSNAGVLGAVALAIEAAVQHGDRNERV